MSFNILNRYPDGLIIDEVQRYPLLLSEIQVRVDENRKKGQYILTGSQQLGLRGAIAQSLAGRTAILHLLPMSMAELKAASITPDLNTLLLAGCYPGVYQDRLIPEQMYEHYVQSYIERDVRGMNDVRDLYSFQCFMRLCAGRVGQILNKNNLAGEVGVSAQTIDNWLGLLEASYVAFLLPPYHENFGKRVIKSPKLYFFDTGLASFLLGIHTHEQMDRDPLRGALFENLVVAELVKTRRNQGRSPRLYFYRDSNQNEVDVLFQWGHCLIPIEIKSSATYHKSFCKGLHHFQAIAGERSVHPSLIYTGVDEPPINSISLRHYANTYQAIAMVDADIAS